MSDTLSPVKPAYTPGPWSLGIVAIVKADGYYQAPDEAIIYCGPDTVQDDNEIRIEGPDALANAALVVATPDLYEAAALLEAAEDAHANCPECDGEIIPELCPVCFPLFDDARLKRRAALAKARGDG